MCVDKPMTERLADANGAIVGRAVAFREITLRGQPERVVTFEVDYVVKGEFGARVQVGGPVRTDCDLAPPEGEAVGVLLTSTPGGGWASSLCGIVSPSQLVAAGDEPRGGSIKIVIGVGIVAAVLGWALVRRRRGSRPDLPGAPLP